MPGPTMRGSGKPKPFKRKSITISTEVVNEGVVKKWQDLPASAVEPGDIVRGRNRGLVTGAVEHSHIVLRYQNGTGENFNPRDVLTVFAPVRG